MGLLNKALSSVEKEEERGGGLLVRAGRYKEKPGGVELVESSKGEGKEGQAKNVEDEIEQWMFRPSPSSDAEGGKERKGLLKRALAFGAKRHAPKRPDEKPVAEKRPAEEQPVEKRRADRRAGRKERRKAEVAAAPSSVAEKKKPQEIEMEMPQAVSAEAATGIGEPMTAQAAGADALGAEGAESHAAVEELPLTGAFEEAAPLEVSALEELQLPVTEMEAPFETGAREPLAAQGEQIPAGASQEEEGGAEAFVLGAEALSVTESIDKGLMPKRRGGLLARASRFAEVEGGKAAAVRPAPRVRPSVRPAVVKKAPREPAVKQQRAAIRQVTVKPVSAVPPKQEVKLEAKLQAEPGAGVPGVEPSAAMKDFAEILAGHLARKDALAVIDLFNEAIAREGHTSFILRLLETMTILGKGKSGILFAPAKELYAIELQVPEIVKSSPLRKVSFREDSRFAQSLKENKAGIFRPDKKKNDGVKKETAKLGSLIPWIAVPLVVGSELTSFFVVGKQLKKPKIDSEGIVLLARLAAPYVNKYLLLKEHRQELYSLEKEGKERDALYSLFSALEIPREQLPEKSPEQSVKELIEGIAASIGIGSAVILADWKSGSLVSGNFVPVASVGVPEKMLSRYRVSWKDGEIRSIIETGKVTVPKDAPKRIAAISKMKEKWLKTYLVVPLLFNGETIGLFVVHDMKGVGKKLSQEAAEKLKHAARVLVPGLLYGKLHSLSPFAVMKELIARQVEKTRDENGALSVAVFTIENAKRAFKELGFGRYWGLVERLRRLIGSVVGQNGIVSEIDWNRLALFLREREGGEIEEVIARVRIEFSGFLQKGERDTGVSLASLMTRYPKESKSAEDILFSVL